MSESNTQSLVSLALESVTTQFTENDTDSSLDLIDQGTKISLGERQKTYEHTEIVPPYQAFNIRADGNCFSSFTSGFKKPFDHVFAVAVNRTAQGVMKHFHCRTVFSCSDEITGIFAPVCSRGAIRGRCNSPRRSWNAFAKSVPRPAHSRCAAACASAASPAPARTGTH